MSELGKGIMLPKQEIEEEEIRRLLLGIMEGYYDTVIPPLSFFSPSAAEKSRKRLRGEASYDDALLKERKRREHMSDNFSVLRSMVPSLFNVIKPSKETIIDKTVDYIKYLEEEAKRLEDLKQFQHENPVMLKSTNHNSSVKVGVSNEATFFAVQLPSRRGSMLKILKVLEKHRAQVLEARIRVNEQRLLTFTATITLRNGGGSSIDKIREEILSL